MISWIYVLHFDKKLHHAQHYIGTTRNLRQRLSTHANGHGSRLTRHLRKMRIGWRLAALYQCSLKLARQIERRTKDQHNAKRYCPICAGKDMSNFVPPAARCYSLDLLPFSVRSDDFALDWPGPETIDYRYSCSIDRPALDYVIRDFMKQDQDALGFIPVGGDQGLTNLINTGRLLLASTGKSKTVGYTAFSLDQSRQHLTVHQCMVDDAYRLQGIGRQMILKLAFDYPDAAIRCKVRDDLPANDFWTSSGFVETHQSRHKSSNALQHHYERQPQSWYTKCKTTTPTKSTKKASEPCSRTSRPKSRKKRDT